jgi:thioredoxin reductase (NADPH)
MSKGNATTDAVIIGMGPAGTQAAIHIARAGLKVTVVGHGGGSLALAGRIDNYYGMSCPIAGAELLKRGEAQLCALGVDIVSDQVVGLSFADAGGGFVASTSNLMIGAKAVLIATGKKRIRVSIDGIERLDGKGVSYCAVCDGFFYKGCHVGVLGYTEYALSEANELARLCRDVTIFTNGEGLSEGVMAIVRESKDFGFVTERIDAVLGDAKLSGVRLSNGETIDIDGLFVAYGTAGSHDLARKIGALANTAGDIVTDPVQATNVPGVFAAGDCTGAFAQIAVAVGQGAIAARSIIDYLR